MKIIKETLFCGRRSGRNYDKFKEASLTPSPARKVKPPIIKECVAHLECKLQSQFEAGDHTIFVGEIVEAYANKKAFTDKYELEKAMMIFHLGGNNFVTLEPKVFTPKLQTIIKLKLVGFTNYVMLVIVSFLSYNIVSRNKAK